MPLKTKKESLPSKPQGQAAAVASPLGISNKLFQPVDASFLALFRIVYGLSMLRQSWVHIEPLQGNFFGRADAYYVRPEMLFSYYGFEWVKPLPALPMHYLFVIMAFLSICVTFGLFYRVSCVLLSVADIYVFLLDKAHYINHYYLIALVSVLLCFMPAERIWSLDARRRPSIRTDVVPAWTLWLLRIQIGIPYLYGGLAKIRADWFAGEPIRTWLSAGNMAQGRLPISEKHLELVVSLVCYGGLVFDLMVVPLLLWRRTRLFAYVAALGFHLANSQLFNIGVFPWFMIGATLVFFEPNSPRRVLAALLSLAARLKQKNSSWQIVHSRLNEEIVTSVDFAKNISPARRRLTLSVMGAYVAFQLLWPFRHFLYEGDPGWNGKGDLFAWRMMLYAKPITDLQFFIVDPNDSATADGQKELTPIPPIKVRRAVTNLQFLSLSRDPDLVLQLAHHFADRYRGTDGKRPEIYANVMVSYNTRAPQMEIDPKVNLSAVERTLWGPTDWIMPFEDTPLGRYKKERAQLSPDMSLPFRGSDE